MPTVYFRYHLIHLKISWSKHMRRIMYIAGAFFNRLLVLCPINNLFNYRRQIGIILRHGQT
jgi:hypothetical protein